MRNCRWSSAAKSPGVAHDDYAPARIVTEDPGHIGDGDADRFQGARRLIDQEPPALAQVDPHELIDDRVDVPVVAIARARRHRREDLADEDAQLLSQGGPGAPIHGVAPVAPRVCCGQRQVGTSAGHRDVGIEDVSVFGYIVARVDGLASVPPL